jgi:hypothetical protein
MKKSTFYLKLLKPVWVFLLVFFVWNSSHCQNNGSKWLTFEGKAGVGKGKRIVLISGDDEYRSEESLPMLAKILSQKYGFTCFVLFPIEPTSGHIVPSFQNDIPGMELLNSADLAILFIRFRELEDEQMAHFHQYLLDGKPIIGLRTSTHAFHYQKNPSSPYAKYDWRNNTKGWEGGFGQKILGETWIAHHGDHGTEGSRVILAEQFKKKPHPILNGVEDIWVPTDVYEIKNLGKDADVLLYGQPTLGMTPTSALHPQKSDMPIAWTKPYQLEGGKKGRSFTTTMGASVDFVNEDLRRLIVNAVFWSLDIQAPSQNLDVNFIDPFHPTPFGFDNFKKGMKIEDFK